MREYSDYIETTRSYLKRYNQFKVTIANLNDDIDAMEHAIEEDVAAPIAKYSGMPGGGTAELNTVESAAARHARMTDMIHKDRESIQNIERILRKVDRAITELKPDDQFLIKGHPHISTAW